MERPPELDRTIIHVENFEGGNSGFCQPPKYGFEFSFKNLNARIHLFQVVQKLVFVGSVAGMNRPCELILVVLRLSWIASALTPMTNCSSFLASPCPTRGNRFCIFQHGNIHTSGWGAVFISSTRARVI